MSKRTKEISNENKVSKSYFRTMIEAIRTARQHYKDMLNREAEKRRLLNSHSDWTLIEELVQEVNDNPDLRIRVSLNDGTNIYLNTYKESKLKDYEMLD